MPEVSIVLSGTHNLQQLKDNLNFFVHTAPNVMSEEDLNFISNIREAYKAKKPLVVLAVNTVYHALKV